jgi:hypothetical protein
MTRTLLQNTSASRNSEGENMAKAHVAAIVSQSTGYILDTDLRQVLQDVAAYARRLEQEINSLRRSLSLPVSETSNSTDSGAVDNESPHKDDVFINGTLSERFERFLLDSTRNRFLGKSSHVELIKTALKVKQKLKEDGAQQRLPPPIRRPQFWRSPVRPMISWLSVVDSHSAVGASRSHPEGGASSADIPRAGPSTKPGLGLF